MHPLLSQDCRRLFQLSRGPFDCVENYYSAILDAKDKEVDLLIGDLETIKQLQERADSDHSLNIPGEDPVTKQGRE